MKLFITLLLFLLGAAIPAVATEQSLLARVTVYWRGEGSGERASWNGMRLRDGHCAVNPKRIPFGSKVLFPDAACLAVDSGPAVISRKAARACARTGAERSAVVIDRFFESRVQAMSWQRSHPYFMTVRVVTPERHRSAPEFRMPVVEASLPATMASRALCDLRAMFETAWLSPAVKTPVHQDRRHS